MAVAVFVGIAVVLVVLAVAAVAVLRESARMEAEPPSRWFEVPEALDWVVRHIADDAAATLTLDDVELVVDLLLEEFRRKGVSRNGGNSKLSGEVVVGSAETVDSIVAGAASRGVGLTNEQVHAVVDTLLAYLRSIGVVGPRAGSDDLPEAP